MTPRKIVLVDAHGERVYGLVDVGLVVTDVIRSRRQYAFMCPCDLGIFGACDENGCETQSGIELAWIAVVEALWTSDLRARQLCFRTIPARVTA